MTLLSYLTFHTSRVMTCRYVDNVICNKVKDTLDLADDQIAVKC